MLDRVPLAVLGKRCQVSPVRRLASELLTPSERPLDEKNSCDSGASPLPATRFDHTEPRMPLIGEPGCNAFMLWLDIMSSAAIDLLLDERILTRDV